MEYERQVRLLAYSLWQANPSNSPTANWLEAERQLQSPLCLPTTVEIKSTEEIDDRHQDLGSNDVNSDVDDEDALIHSLPDELLLEIFKYVPGISRIRTIGLVCQRWRGIISMVIGKELNLTSFENIRETDDTIIFALAKLKPAYLTSVDISGCVQVTEAGFKALGQLNLRCLKAQKFHISTLTSKWILQSLSNVEELDLTGSKFQGPSSPFKFDQKPMSTKILRVSDLHSGFGREFLQHFHKLETVELSDALTRNIHDLKACSNLVNLTLTHCTIMNTALARLTQLKTLRLDDVCLQGTSYYPRRPEWSGLVEALQGMPELTTLKLINLRGSWSHLDDEIVCRAIQTRPNLKSLTIQDEAQLSDRVINTLTKNTNGCLENLVLPQSDKFSNGAMVVLLKKSPKLHTLSIAACSRITDETVLALIEFCPKLVELNVSRCTMLTEFSIRDAVLKLALLKRVVCYGVHLAFLDNDLLKIASRRGVVFKYRDNASQYLLEDVYTPASTDDTFTELTSDMGTGNCVFCGKISCQRYKCHKCSGKIHGCVAQDHKIICTSTTCPSCGVSISKLKLHHHLSTECKMNIISCIQCSETLPRCDLRYHQETMHKEKVSPTRCPLRVVGCLHHGALNHMGACPHWEVVCKGCDVTFQITHYVTQHQSVCPGLREQKYKIRLQLRLSYMSEKSRIR